MAKAPPAISTIIFDLDGTLIDSEPVQARVIEMCFQEWKMKVKPEDAAYITGRTARSTFEYLFSRYKIPLTLDQAIDRMGEIYREEMERHLPFVPGSAEAVRALARVFDLALVSGSSRREIHWALDKVGVRTEFKIILGCEDYPRSKPAPDGFLKAMQMLGRKPEETVIFEDSAPGVTAARAAGCWVVAITSTNHYGHDQSPAHLKIPDLHGVTPEWVRSKVRGL